MEEQLSEHSSFVVKNSVVAEIIIATVSFGIALSAILYNWGSDHFDQAFLMGFIPGIGALAAMFYKKPLIVVNSKGIFTTQGLITDWPHFTDSYFTQQEITGSISDNFVLIVEYSKSGIGGFFKATIGLSATQNKSEEAVLNAIHFYYDAYKKSRIVCEKEISPEEAGKIEILKG